MPLKINLRKGHKIIINGAVLENIASHNISFLVMNDAAILRDTDIMTPEDAVTPAGRVYYFAQCIYIFPNEREHYRQLFDKFIGEYLESAPSSEPVVDEIRKHMEDGEFYSALKAAVKLIEHERKVLDYAQQTLSQELRESAIAGESEGN